MIPKLFFGKVGFIYPGNRYFGAICKNWLMQSRIEDLLAVNRKEFRKNSCRKRYGKSTTLIHNTDDLNVTAKGINNGLDKAQSQTNPEFMPDRVTAIKSFENFRNVLLGNAHSGILKPDMDALICSARRNGNLPPLPVVFYGIFQQVGDQSLEHVFI